MVQRVEGHADLVKDPRSGAVINVDTSAYDSYMQMVKTRDQNKKQTDDRITNLEKDVGQIMNVLNQILERVS